uniref:Uncharacterized protein n=1 Tax=Parastrongyloides trichosuri TaxID=131310 RepID=A0A0N4ZQK9_PARTI
MLILTYIFKSITLFVVTLTLTIISNCANRKELRFDMMNRKGRKKRSALEYEKLAKEADTQTSSGSGASGNKTQDSIIEKEIKNFNCTVDKIIKNNINVSDNKNAYKTGNKSIGKKNGIKSTMNSNILSKSSKETNVKAAKSPVKMVESPTPMSFSKGNMEKSLQKTVVYDTNVAKDFKSLLETSPHQTKQSSSREGGGHYNSLKLVPISPDSPVQCPKLAELDCFLVDEANNKDNGNGDFLAKTQSLSTVTRGEGKKLNDTIDEMFTNSIFSNTNKCTQNPNYEDTTQEATNKITRKGKINDSWAENRTQEGSKKDELDVTESIDVDPQQLLTPRTISVRSNRERK